MRAFLAGFTLILALTSAAMAQVTGFVETVGIAGRVRPDCWNPLLINLTSQVSEPMTYQVQVWQEDLDRDHAVFTKEITLSPKLQEKFQLYFIPQPTADSFAGVGGFVSAQNVQKDLRVRVCLPLAEGRKPDDAKVVIDRLPITSSTVSIDPIEQQAIGAQTPGRRLVLWITDGSSRPAFGEYQGALGLAEQVETVPLHPEELGENVLFYDSVDAVVWLSGNADELDRAGARRLEALSQFVRQGGKLIVCQPSDRQKIEALAPLLPIQTKNAAGEWLTTFGEKATLVDEPHYASKTPLDILPKWSRPTNNPGFLPTWHLIDSKHDKPIQIAKPQLKADAVVCEWQSWPKEPESAYLVRRSLGTGCVTWVAQDLGDKNLTGADSYNWPHIWDRVIGWGNSTVTAIDFPKAKQDSEESSQPNRRTLSPEEQWSNGDGGLVDLGSWLLRGTDYAGKSAAYISLAVAFFIIYWIFAGPASYLFLAGRKKRELSWFVFGAIAVGAMLFTVLVVRLVLRGAAEVRHLSVVRATAGEPTVVYSRLGVYVPRDGDQAIAFEDTSHDAISFLTALEEHPQYVAPTDFPAAQDYTVPVHDDPQSVIEHIPFRSTLKKLQGRWIGDLPASITGSARLLPQDQGFIAGTLTNNTGSDLINIYFVFNYPDGKDFSNDRVMYVPTWRSGEGLDLGAQWAGSKYINDSGDSSGRFANPSDNPHASITGAIGIWGTYWGAHWGSSDNRGAADFEGHPPMGFVILSLFDRVHPIPNTADGRHRIDFTRRGGRHLDMSGAVAAGKLVVLAQSADDSRPLPFSMTVEGSKVSGQGRVLYQFALPVDRSPAVEAAKKVE